MKRNRVFGRWGPWACAAVLACTTTPAHATPQVTTDIVVGIAGNGDRSELWSKTGFLGGVRGELLFGRERDSDFGAGPYVETLTTTGFSDVQAGAGGSLLVPIHPYLPAVISAGVYWGSTSTSGWQPGLSGELFWGTHSFNYHSPYSLSAGLFVGGRYSLADSRAVSILAGARVDLEVLALPFLLAWEAARGGNSSR